jgi:hypothetical protein
MEVFYPEAIIIATRGERDVVIGRAGEARLGGYPGWPLAALGLGPRRGLSARKSP